MDLFHIYKFRIFKLQEKAIDAEFEGMKAANLHASSVGNTIPYDDEAFILLSNDYKKLRKEVEKVLAEVTQKT